MSKEKKSDVDLINLSKEYWNKVAADQYDKIILNRETEEHNLARNEVEVNIYPEVSRKVLKICNNNDLAIYMFILAVFKASICRYFRNEKFLIGMPQYLKSGDIKSNNKFIILANDIDQHSKFKEILINGKNEILELYRHQFYPMNEMYRASDIYKKVNLYCCMKNIQSASQVQDILELNNNELTLIIEKYNDGIGLTFNHYNFLVSYEVNKFISVFMNILNSVVENIEIKIKDIEILSQEEKNKLLIEFNNTKMEYPRNKTIDQLFEEQVERTPDNTAVVYDGEELSYSRLNKKANSLAVTLREKGVGPDVVVAMIVERSLDMIIGIMGVLKAGGAYLPIDSECPEERIKYMLENSGTRILLTQSSLIRSGKVENIGSPIEICDLNREELYSSNDSNLEKVHTAGDLAYVIYTSGTTGKPKGVMIEHKSAAATLIWRKNEYKFSTEDSVLQLFSNAFDGFVTSFFTPIISGAKVVLTSGDNIKNILKIKDLLIKYKITNFISVPSLGAVIMDSLTDKDDIRLKSITFAGEQLTNNLIEKCKSIKNDMEIINEYGPTENSVVTTIKRNIQKKSIITIGKPIDNTKVYIVDENYNLVPIGVPGELCISGDGLARGYLNNEELTKEKFVDNPYEMGQKMYRTGDLAKWMPDGNIEFLGRIDHQVKIRGFRIELGEIESSLLKIEGIKEAVVTARGEGENKYLCAYYVGEKEYGTGSLREELKKSLPDYMIPAYFVKLESIPLTHNGKMDRKALPKPEGKINTGAEYEAPRNELEERLVQIWEDILGVDNVGINDNFFDLGGHSLKATTLMARIYKDLEVEVPLKEIFDLKNIKKLSEYISSTDKKKYEAIEKVEEKEYYEASSAQRRMYLLQELDKDSTAYNIAGGIEVLGKLQIDKMNAIFMKLIDRHEALRTSFHLVNDSIVQKIHGIEEIKLEIEKIEVKNEKEVKEKIKAFIKPFDLEKAPLFRAAVITLEKDRHIMLFDMHHIISDGVSMSILIKEFGELYAGKELKGLRIQYKDYAAWQLKKRESEEFKKQEEYWLKEFKGEIPVLNLPADYTRPKAKDFKGRSINFVIDKETTEGLRKLAGETESTLYMVLLSNVNILLSKYSGQKDIVVGTPIAGRNHTDLENVIGMFVNTLAVRSTVNSELSFEDYLETVKVKALKAYENQDYQFEELVEKINVDRDLSRNPLFDVMFVLQNMDKSKIDIGDLRIKPYVSDSSVEKFDITIAAAEEKEEIHFSLSYASSLYKQETMERMIDHFLNIIKCTVKNREIKLKDIEILSQEEKNKLLVEFNNTKMEYPRNKTIDQLFEEQVERTPDNIAVVYDGEELTYIKLNKKANSLARTLREKGIGPGIAAAMIVERSLEMIIGIMGVLKAGGAYVPIDPECPKERIKYMLENSEAKILLTQSSLIRSGRVESIGSQVEIFDLNREELYSSNDSNLEKVHTPDDLAYVIYTSGTTGKPKGVMVEHRAVSNLVTTLKNDIYSMYGPALRAALVSPYYFDASVKQIFTALTEGHALHIVPESTRKNGEELLKYYEKNHIDTSDGTPMHLSMIINSQENTDNLSLKHMIIGGDKLLKDQVKEAYDKFPNLKINNVYGPTECCVDSAIYLADKKSLDNMTVIPIGEPIGNTRIYIVDENYNLVPIGMPGEMCVSGDGLARGYLNNEELTKEKFVDNPYEMGQKMYRTGDLAKWMPDGNIEFLGRIDHQVKIRGFRIELGEIESSLLKIEGIKEAVVTARGEGENKYLCAYYSGEKEYSTGQLRKELKKLLPEYMMPECFMKLKCMPLTANGKLDRRSLPEPEGKINTGAEYEAPRNELEERLLQIWEQVLGVSNIGINDNFFELGGHSLKATTLLGRINRELEVEVPLREIFEAGTIKGLSEYISSTDKKKYESIEKVEEKEYYEASSAQKRMYLLHELDKNSTAYNMPVSLEILGNIETNRIGEIFTKLIERHEALRTSFQLVDGSIVQKIYCIEEIKLEIEKIEVKNEKEVKEKIKAFIKPFNLEKAPLFRAVVITLEKDRHIMFFDMHHIISDGVSMSILIKEFGELYAGKELEELRIQYKDYAAWQLKKRESEEFKEQEEYWLKEFKGEIPVLNLPADYSRPKAKDFKGRSIDFVIDKETTEGLRKLAGETKSTLYMVLLSNINILLSKYSGQEDIVVGSPIAGRNHTDLENVIGMFVNTLAVRSTVNSELSFEDYLETVKVKALKAYENQDYQFEELVEKINVNRDLRRNPLFDVMFVLQNMGKSKIEIGDLTLKPYVSDSNVEKFDITIAAAEEKEEIHLNLSYASSLYKHETMERMIEHFLNIIKCIVKNRKIKLKDIEILSEKEKNKLLVEFNNTKADYPKNKTVSLLFEEQVERTPNSTAVVFEDNSLAYKELNKKANSLARSLREKGVGPDTIVGIMVKRSIEMIVGIMGVLKAGGAYLPIDPEYPEGRIKYMLENSRTKIVLTQGKFKGKINKENIAHEIEICDLNSQDLYNNNSSNLERIAEPNNLAYVIYTSGTTGNPKGVMIENRSIINRINWMQRRYPLDHNDTILQKTTNTFDVSLWEILWWSFVGAKVRMLIPDGEKDPGIIVKNIKEGNITTIHFIPSMFIVFINYVISENKVGDIINLKKIFTSGEALKPEQANLFYEKIGKINNTRLINLYGPTEAAVEVTYYECGENEKVIPIGKPIDNIKMYVIDKNKNLLPVGVVGELCISGVGLARGYLSNKELTKEKFVDNPYEIGQKMYKTGDLAKWMEDGNIEFLGRIDHQVKIRGFRIELGEIESSLLKIEGIKEAVVIARGEEENKYLCAYYVGEKEYSTGELRKELKKLLPDYMLPGYFMRLKCIPLTSNGKIDRKTLPKPEGKINTGAEYEAPRNELEETLVRIWEDILGADSVGINDNFFDLGGHSLKATTLMARIYKDLEVEVPLREIFEAGTIKKLSEYISSTDKKKYEAIEKVEEKEYYEASSAQRRMYLLQELDKDSTAYNMAGSIEVLGKLQIDKMNAIFMKLIDRHEALRTSFHLVNDSIVQKIYGIEEIKLEIEKIEVKAEEEVKEKIKAFIKPFDLEKAPLFRAAVITLEKDRHIMLFDMHHIISDGVSMSILIKEFGELYAGKELEELRIQYKDYAAWQLKKRESEEFKKQEEYWLKEFKEEIPVLNLPADYSRPKAKDFKGRSIDFVIDKETTEGLRKLASETGSTLYMVLLSDVNILLSKYSGQKDIVVGSPIAGRNHTDLKNVIGMFVNTLAVRSTVNSELSFEDYLETVKVKALKAYENQDYQFEELVEKINVDRDLSRNPLFDVMFVLQNMDKSKIDIGDLTLKPYVSDSSVEKFDMTIAAAEEKKEIHLNLSYASSLYKDETMERMIDHFLNIIKCTVKNREIKLKDIEILSEKEKSKLLVEFNNTKKEYPRNKTIDQLFEEQVERTPDNIAVVYDREELTYSKLNKKANSLARTLREKGAGPDAVVAMIVERSLDMIIGIMGVLKAGGAYLPIDPECPEERIKYMLENSGAKILLTQSSLIRSGKVENIGSPIEICDLNREDLYNGNSSNLEKIAKPNNLAYVIYTSGTTGKPKGVMMEHRSVSNFVTTLKNDIYSMYEPALRAVLVSPYYFDASVQQMFAALTEGHALHVVPESTRKNGEELLKYYERNHIDTSDGTPMHLSMITNEQGNTDNSNLKHMIIGGDKLLKDQVKEAYDKFPNLRINNVYGPTECCVNATIYLIDRESLDNLTVIPIGKPLGNTRIYIVDKNYNLMPIGVPGELCVSGDGLARGYLNNKALTEEKFVDNPYEMGQKMYRTGDLAAWMPDGNIQFLGRIDNQIKIRGFRIELGEIESSLLKIEGIKEAVVIAKGEEDKYLCAYYVGEKEYGAGRLREELKKSLPDYMIPVYFIKLKNIPLTANGKLDRRSLPEPEGKISTGAEYEAPRNELEEKLVQIWEQVLGVSDIGINDNFFELGGHSIKLLKLALKINKELNIRVPLEMLLANQTIKDIHRVLSSGLIKKDKFFARLSYNGDKNIFAFPPIVGYGYSYLYLAKLINTHSIYAFNFIDSINIIDEYIENIIDIQNRGPFILLGYSAGGSLAFDAAKGLEAKGCHVSDIIMIDSTVNELTQSSFSEDLMEGSINKVKDFLRDNGIYDFNADIEQNAVKTYKKYWKYINKNLTVGKIKSNIHIISNSKEDQLSEHYDCLLKWRKFTSGQVILYYGYGGHEDMLSPEYCEKNADIIKGILSTQQL